MLPSAVSNSGVIAVSTPITAFISMSSRRPTALQPVDRACCAPAKTGGTGDNIGFGRTGLALCEDSEHGITGAAEVLVFITAIVGLAVISLQKQPEAAQGVRLRRAVRQCYRPRFQTNRDIGLPSLLLARSGRQLHKFRSFAQTGSF